MGGDVTIRMCLTAVCYFNPRPPHGGRLGGVFNPDRSRRDFNPRPPHGGRPLPACQTPNSASFQSTPPAWGATRPGGDFASRSCISIHAPRMGGDNSDSPLTRRQRHFNPRPPHGGRRQSPTRPPPGHRISIHAPRMGGDTVEIVDCVPVEISIHAPRMGGDSASGS